jgi:uncharacterized protein (TIGR00730 family)
MAEAERPAVISVFGSSRIALDGPEYREAYEVGRLLAEAGYVVCNGGYSGTMEGVSHGAKEAGGRTIGITVGVFSGRSANPYIDEEIGTEDLLLRLDKLTGVADGYIILGGGIGTLLELALVWNLQVMGVFNKPIVLLGQDWRAAVERLAEHLMVRDADWEALSFVETPQQAVEALKGTRPRRGSPGSDWQG